MGGASRSVGQAMFWSGTGTSDSRGPPVSSAASAAASTLLVAADQASNSSIVMSLVVRFVRPMNLFLMVKGRSHEPNRCV
jgi:hypothetical protein